MASEWDAQTFDFPSFESFNSLHSFDQLQLPMSSTALTSHVVTTPPALREKPQPIRTDLPVSSQQQQLATPLTGNVSATMLLTPSSPMKRRQNYLLEEHGPDFSQTTMTAPVWTNGRESIFEIQAKMDKGFFVDDNCWTSYRRNYFQLSVAVNATNVPVFPEIEQYYVEYNGVSCPVHEFKVGLSARIGKNGKEIVVIQHTSKRDKGPQVSPKAQSIRVGGSMNDPRTSLSSQVLSAALSNKRVVTFDRLQFKSATANNGKKRASQEYFELIVNLFALVQYGDLMFEVPIGYCTSVPLIVRGRSPAHYAQTKSPYPVGLATPMSATHMSPPSHVQNNSDFLTMSMMPPIDLNHNFHVPNVPMDNVSAHTFML